MATKKSSVWPKHWHVGIQVREGCFGFDPLGCLSACVLVCLYVCLSVCMSVYQMKPSIQRIQVREGINKKDFLLDLIQFFHFTGKQKISPKLAKRTYGMEFWYI